MAFVYILKFETGKYYVGSTTNLQNRMNHHAGGYTPSTKRLGQGQLVLAQEYPTLSAARFIERKLKKLKRRDYIAQMVADGYIRIVP